MERKRLKAGKAFKSIKEWLKLIDCGIGNLDVHTGSESGFVSDRMTSGHGSGAWTRQKLR